jgi:ArsR family transcriptional regulator
MSVREVDAGTNTPDPDRGECGTRSASATHVDAIDDATADRLARTFKALADPTRVRILSLLAAGELCVHEIADSLKMTHSAISHQLATLRDMRLVRFRRQGRHVYYALDDEHIEGLFACGLDHVRHD